MKDGFIKIATISPQIKVADCEFNETVIYETIKAAAEANAVLAVLPELTITGCSCGDLFFQKKLQQAAKKTIVNLARRCAWEIVAIVGVPFEKDGKLYDCAAVMYKGHLLGIVPKVKQSETFGRWFAPAEDKNCTIELGGEKIPFGAKLLFRANTMPEFCFGCEIGDDLFTPFTPSDILVTAGANIIANCSADAELAGRSWQRQTVVLAQSTRLRCGYMFANAATGESSSHTVYSGENFIAENGRIIAHAKPFDNGYCASVFDLQLLGTQRAKNNRQGYEEACDTVPFDLLLRETRLERPYPAQPFVPEKKTEREVRAEEILQIQAHGLAKRLKHTEAQKILLGISGGLDSTLAVLVCIRALDIENRSHSRLLCYTMPCFGTSERTKNNAITLCEALGAELREVEIKKSVRLHFKDLGHDGKTLDATFENAQARERTQLLMDAANMEKGIVVGTGDMSELALGWATFNGDHMSMYSINGGVTKTQIRAIIEYIADRTENKKLKTVLNDILCTPVSPELLPAKQGKITQETEEIVGPYELHDFFLYWFIRGGFSPEKLCRMAKYAFGTDYTETEILATLRKFLSRFFSQQFKRNCQPDGVTTGDISLLPSAWQCPSDAMATLWMSEMDDMEAEYKIKSLRPNTSYEQYKKNRRAKKAEKIEARGTKTETSAIDNFLRKYS